MVGQCVFLRSRWTQELSRAAAFCPLVYMMKRKRKKKTKGFTACWHCGAVSVCRSGTPPERDPRAQSTGPWKMSLEQPWVRLSWVAQKGQAAWKAWVPWGRGISAQYLTDFSEHTCPHGTKACVGAPVST